jgi:hypothetical protein
MQNLIKTGDRVKLNTDDWDDSGKIFTVKKAIYRPGSTAVELTFVEGKGQTVVPYHFVEVINDSIQHG